ncbi:MAG TPA: FAD-dependent oxidoreductase [Burkholderiales bacterium]|nr:FAD-dependent oxidoreductase [Burkholderiales bacterium]
MTSSAARGHRIVVVGRGAAGLCAALSAAETARDRGIDAHVTVLDRAPEASCGGNSRWSPANLRMRAPDAMEPGFVDEVVAQSGGRADRAYFERLEAEAPATARWLQGKGVKFQSPPYYLSKGSARIQPVGGGAALLDALWRAAQAAGIELLYGRELRRLIVEAGRVAGVETGTAQAILRADAVVLACGGFEGNGELLRQHLGPGAERLRPISPGTGFNDGAGIRAALEVGARRSGDWNGMHAEPVDARSQVSAPVVLVYPYGIVVDRDGRRFFDEGAGLVHETWEKFARDLHFSRPGRTAYAILDAGLLEIPEYGRAIRSDVPPTRADSIPELATQLGIPAAALAETVRDCNAACTGDVTCFDETRMDGLTSAPGLSPRKSNWARPLARAPFLAWPLVGAIAYTFGGIETDAEARVLGGNGPIDGLYAAGEITGHFYGTAPNAVALLRALVFGRIAGTSAIRSI